MEVIEQNPYRIAGILANASTKELEKQKTKLKAYTKVGKEIKSDYDFEILTEITRTEELTNQAFSLIEQNHDKVNHALFWFLEASPIDKTAIEYLKSGNEMKAAEIWLKITTNKEVSSKNYSALNNIGTIKLLSSNKLDIQEGILNKIRLINSEHFKDFVHSVADETYTIHSQKQSEILIDELLSQFQNQYSNSETLELFNKCDGFTQQYLSKKFTEEPLHKIEIQIEKSKKNRKTNKTRAYDIGLNLYTNTKTDLSHLKSLLGSNNLKYKAVADQLANEIMQCGIDYFNEQSKSESTDDHLDSAQKLTKIAETIAEGKLTKDRVLDSLVSLEEMRDQIVNDVVQLLESIKIAYEANETKVKQQVESIKNELAFKLGQKTLDQAAIKNAIKNSIDWQKVNELLNGILPLSKLTKIKSSSNDELKSEFSQLSYWLENHSQSKATIKKILETYRSIKPDLPFNIISSSIKITDKSSVEIKKPLYTKFIRYINLTLEVQATKSGESLFYIKYINPDGTTRRNSKTSPINYTTKSKKSINRNTNIIELIGWGSSDSCSYNIGENKIEVYVDEYLIYSKNYSVQLAPSERIEKEINKVEKEITKIKNSDYYALEINSGHLKLKELQKFKLFRGSATKQKQIREQQQRILTLTELAQKEKKRDLQNQEEKLYKLKMELSQAKY